MGPGCPAKQAQDPSSGSFGFVCECWRCKVRALDLPSPPPADSPAIVIPLRRVCRPGAVFGGLTRVTWPLWCYCHPWSGCWLPWRGCAPLCRKLAPLVSRTLRCRSCSWVFSTPGPFPPAPPRTFLTIPSQSWNLSAFSIWGWTLEPGSWCSGYPAWPWSWACGAHADGAQHPSPSC